MSTTQVKQMTDTEYVAGMRVRYVGLFSVPADYFPSGHRCVAGSLRYPPGTEGMVDGSLDLYSKVLLRVRWADGFMSHVDARDVEALDD